MNTMYILGSIIWLLLIAATWFWYKEFQQKQFRKQLKPNQTVSAILPNGDIAEVKVKQVFGKTAIVKPLKPKNNKKSNYDYELHMPVEVSKTNIYPVK